MLFVLIMLMLYVIIDIATEREYHWGEQGGLNELFAQQKYSFEVVDGPERLKNVFYNARSKGHVQGLNVSGKFHPNRLNSNCNMTKFYVKDNKLFSKDNKQIKVWHYMEGFGVSKQKMIDVLNYYIFDIFNEETKNFFEKECDCGNFFNERYED